MRILIIAIIVIVGLYLIDKIFLWFEQKGWIYWRKKKPDVGAGIGNALQQLNTFLNPSSQYTIEAKQTKIRKSEQGDDKDK